jgi:hypothetical protein
MVAISLSSVTKTFSLGLYDTATNRLVKTLASQSTKGLQTSIDWNGTNFLDIAQTATYTPRVLTVAPEFLKAFMPGTHASVWWPKTKRIRCGINAISNVFVEGTDVFVCATANEGGGLTFQVDRFDVGKFTNEVVRADFTLNQLCHCSDGKTLFIYFERAGFAIPDFERFVVGYNIDRTSGTYLSEVPFSTGILNNQFRSVIALKPGVEIQNEADGMSVQRNGNLLAVSSDGRIDIHDKNTGALIRSHSGIITQDLTRRHRLAFDALGNLWIAIDNTTLRSYTSASLTTATLSVFKTITFNGNIGSIAAHPIDPEYFIVPDRSTNQFKAITSTGRVLRTFGSSLVGGQVNNTTFKLDSGYGYQVSVGYDYTFWTADTSHGVGFQRIIEFVLSGTSTYTPRTFMYWQTNPYQSCGCFGDLTKIFRNAQQFNIDLNTLAPSKVGSSVGTNWWRAMIAAGFNPDTGSDGSGFSGFSAVYKFGANTIAYVKNSTGLGDRLVRLNNDGTVTLSNIYVRSFANNQADGTLLFFDTFNLFPPASTGSNRKVMIQTITGFDVNGFPIYSDPSVLTTLAVVGVAPPLPLDQSADNSVKALGYDATLNRVYLFSRSGREGGSIVQRYHMGVYDVPTGNLIEAYFPEGTWQQFGEYVSLETIGTLAQQMRMNKDALGRVWTIAQRNVELAGNLGPNVSWQPSGAQEGLLYLFCEGLFVGTIGGSLDSLDADIFIRIGNNFVFDFQLMPDGKFFIVQGNESDDLICYTVDPSKVTIASLPTVSAVAVTFTGPTASAQNTASTNFTLTPSAPWPTGTVITPSDDGFGGTFTPISITPAPGTTTPATFTYRLNSATIVNIKASITTGATNPRQLELLVGTLPDPTGYANLVSWHKSDSGVTSASNLVSAWASAVSGGINVTQATATRQPLLIPNALNGYPSLRFTKANSQTLSITGTCPANGAVPITIIVVARPSSVSTAGAFVKVGTDSTGYALGVGSGNLDTVGNSIIALDETRQFRASVVPLGTGFSVTSYRTLANNASSIWANGKSAINFDAATKVAPSATDNYSLGGYTNRYFDGDIVEVIIYQRSLSDTEMTNLLRHLQLKYF